MSVSQQALPRIPVCWREAIGIFRLMVIMVAVGLSGLQAQEAPKGGEEAQKGGKNPAERGPKEEDRQRLKQALERLLKPDEPENGNDSDSGSGKEVQKSRRLEDPRAAIDQQAWDLLEAVRKEVGEQKPQEALANLQKLIERKEDSLYFTESRTWVSVREEAQRLFQALPAKARQAYETQYGGLAQQQLQQALSSGSPQQFAEVASRYLNTSSGAEGANHLASRHIDHQEYAAAHVWMRRLVGVNADVCRSIPWKLKALRVAGMTGDEEWSRALLAELSQVPAEQLKLGDVPVDLKVWSQGRVEAEVPTASDWPVFYGNESRNGIQRRGTPWLRPRWQIPFAASDLVQQVTSDLWKELQDRRIAALPANQPLAVGDHLVVRNWQGVQVFQASSGKLLWEARDRISAEEMLLALHRSWLTQIHSEADEEDHRDPLGWASMSLGQQIWQGSGGEFSPVAHFLFRDYNYGLQSSDGERLFVIHELPVLTFGQPRQGMGSEEASDLDPFGRHWSSNVLAAYDLKTGRRLWEAGGAVDDLEFETPLSGWFFLGAPVPHGGELLCVAEKKGEIRLLALDPERGNIRWSQLLGYSEIKINEDVGRQWMSVQPTIAEGLVVCPLMTGWIVAVDRLTHSIVWGAQTRASQRQEGGQGLTPSGLSERWGLSPLIVAGDRLLCTPQEGRNLVCLKLQSGKILWNRPRGDGLYVAGVQGGNAVVVGKSQVRGYELSEGKDAWKCPLPDHTYVTGRGLITEEGILQLPVSGGELVCVSLKEHAIQSRLRQMPTGGEHEVTPVGNLVRCGDLWCAVHPLGIQAFESQDVLEAESKQGGGQSRDAGWSQRQASWLSMRGDYKQAWALLQSQPGKAGDQSSEPLRGEVLVELLRAEGAKPVTDEVRQVEAQGLEWLKQAKDPALKAKVRGALAGRFRGRGEAVRAFEILWELAVDEGKPKVGEVALWILGEEGVQKSRADVWLSRQLQETFQSAADSGRKELDARLERIIQERLKASADVREKTLRLLAFHPATLPIRWALVEELAARREWSSAEVLIREVEGLMPEREGEVAERLVSLQMAAGRREDASWLLKETMRCVPKAQTRGGESFAAWGERLRREGKIGEIPAVARPVSEMKLQKEGGHGDQVPLEEIAIPVEASPGWRQWQLLISPAEQRFILRNARTNQIEWSLPLRSRAETVEGRISSHFEGDRLYLWFRGVLHALAPFERRVLWTRSLGSLQPVGEEGTRSEVFATRALNALSKSVLSQRLVDDVWGRDPLQLLGAGVLAYRHRRSLEVMDSRTGETLWTLEGLTTDIEVRGDGSCLFLFSTLSKTSQARSVREGRLLDVPSLNQNLRQTVQFSGHRLIRYERAAGEGSQKPWAVASYDPLVQKNVWERKYVEEPLIGCLSEQAMVVKREGNELELVDLGTGTAQGLGRVEWPGSARTLTAFRDWSHVYVTVNRGGRTLFQDGLPLAEVNGTIYAFSGDGQGLRWKKELRGGRGRWDREAGGYGLILAGLDHSSVLLFSRREFERRGNNDDFGLWTQKLLAVDKFSGNEVLKTSLAPASGFREMTVNPAEGTLELRGYDQRIRLVPTAVPDDGAAKPAGGK